MLRHLSLLACLVVTTAASAIGPGDYPSLGPPGNDAGNGAFLSAAAALDAQYGPPGGSTAGPTFFNATGVAGISGYRMRLWFVSAEADGVNAFGVRQGGVDSIAFADGSALSFGDYVDLPGVGQHVSFFALTGIVGGEASHQFWDGTFPNADGRAHITISLPQFDGDSLWYAVALEDMFGSCGITDWDDMRLVLQLTQVAVPEPGTMGLMLGFLAGGAWLLRRRRQAIA